MRCPDPLLIALTPTFGPTCLVEAAVATAVSFVGFGNGRWILSGMLSNVFAKFNEVGQG